VAVDARELCGKPTGVGRYLHELLAEWAASAEARRHAWTLYAPSIPRVPEAFVERVAVLPGAGGTRWEQWTLARGLAAARPDVLFAPGYSAPLTAPCPTVLAIHDVSFAARPGWFSAREGARRRAVTRWSARRARIVLTISEFSRHEIERHLGIAPGRIRVTVPGVRRPPAAVDGPREPIVLYVGSIFARRHVDVLIDAFAAHVAPAVPGARLVIVGENRLPVPTALDRVLAGLSSAVRPRIEVRSYVDEATLAGLYSGARVFAFLSEYEGFGLTPVEAMAHGVAPVVLDTPVAREVNGPAAAYLPLDDALPGTLGRTLVTLLTSEAARVKLVNEAPAVLARYDWGRTAAATLAALEEAAGAR
jgi:glycosyltransferase involved in cell wall biosynthesis